MTGNDVCSPNAWNHEPDESSRCENPSNVTVVVNVDGAIGKGNDIVVSCSNGVKRVV